MAFLEQAIDECISFGMTGGPGFSTTIATTDAGFENRNANWSKTRRSYEFGYRARTLTERAIIEALFLVAKGKANGWRLKDIGDYAAVVANGRLGELAVGDGTPTYKFYKAYTSGAETSIRRIAKPVAGSIAVFRNAAPVTVGGAAGNIAIDTVNGQVTFVADASSNASSITVGVTTQVELAANPGGLIAGEQLYLTGFTGTDAALVNSLAHIINSVTGTGPYTFTLATNTAGKTITVGAGAGTRYPQASEALTWSGSFDVPVRFGIDKLDWTYANEGADGILFDSASIPVVELRLP